MRVSSYWLAGAAVLALVNGAALAEEAATPVPAPSKVESAPLPAPTPKSVAPLPQALAPSPLPLPLPKPTAQAVAPAPTPTAQVAAPAPKPAAVPTPAASAAPVAAPTPAASASPAPAPSTATVNPADATTAAPIPADVAPKPKKSRPAPPPLETVLSNDPTPTLTAQTFFATQKAAEHYAEIVDRGGWATDLPALHPGSQGEYVAKLRRHLAIEGDLESAGSGASARKWDGALTAAVKHFQRRMGLRETGSISGATLKAINVPAEERRQELAASAARLSNIHPEFERRYVVVNLPSTQVEAVQDGRVVHHYISIVGDPDHPSPEISAHISVVNLNPTWTVPTSIIKKEIIPHIQRDPSYLARMKIRVLDGQLHEVDPRSVNWSSERAANYILRQDSGAGNSLGSIRIGMPNKLAVYMHDTPGKAAFGRDFRFLSHGCVRVQGVWDYAAWLLEDTPGGPTGAWDKESLLTKMKDKERYDIKLTHAVPVYWVYLTGWANEDGVVNFRNDVYGIDPAAEATASAAAARAEADTAASASASVDAAVPAPAPVAASTPMSIFDFLKQNNH